jgi:hypothetical protein
MRDGVAAELIVELSCEAPWVDVALFQAVGEIVCEASSCLPVELVVTPVGIEVPLYAIPTFETVPDGNWNENDVELAPPVAVGRGGKPVLPVLSTFEDDLDSEATGVPTDEDGETTVALIAEPPSVALEPKPDGRGGVDRDDPAAELSKELEPVSDGARERMDEPTDAGTVLDALGNIEPAELTRIEVAFDGENVSGAREDAVSEAGVALAPMDRFGVGAWKVDVGVTVKFPVPAGVGKIEAPFEMMVEWKGVPDVLDPTDGDSTLLELPLEAAGVAADETIADGTGVIDALAPPDCELISMEVLLAATPEPAGGPGKLILNATEGIKEDIGPRIPLGLAASPVVMGGGCGDANGVPELEAEPDTDALIPWPPELTTGGTLPWEIAIDDCTLGIGVS